MVHPEHIELGEWTPKDSATATLVGTPSSFHTNGDNSYFELETPIKASDFQELTTSVSDDIVYPLHVSYKGHQVVVDSSDFRKSVVLKFQILVAFLYLIFTGLAEQSSGTLLPSFVEYYHVDHSAISYIFISGFCGSLVAATLNEYLHKTIGIYGILLTSCCAWCLCYVIASTSPPLWVLVAGYFSHGFAGGCANGVLNIWGGKLKYHNQIMGILHAFFGFGCMITPVVATHLLETGMPWNHWYYVLICGTVVLFICTLFTFHRETQWKYRYLVENGDESDEEDDDDVSTTRNGANLVSFSRLMKNKFVWFFSLTLFFYLGGEASIGNWVYNYLIIIKKVTASESSYITSTYWLSLTLGRVFLGLIIGKFFENNETTIAFILCVLISIFTFFFEQFSSLLLQSLSIYLVGAFIGPVFPTTIIIALKTLPLNFHALGVGFISSCGSSGTALIPYIIGYVSSMNKGAPGYVEGEGLVYFPLISLFVFTVAMVLWGGFFVYQQKLKKVKSQNSVNGVDISYERI